MKELLMIRLPWSGRLAPPSRVPLSLVALAQSLRRATRHGLHHSPPTIHQSL